MSKIFQFQCWFYEEMVTGKVPWMQRKQ